MVKTGDKKAFCVLEFTKMVICDSATEVADQVPHRTTYEPNNSQVVQGIPAEWLAVHCKMNRPAKTIFLCGVEMEVWQGSSLLKNEVLFSFL
jgi:hypothetical protein